MYTYRTYKNGYTFCGIDISDRVFTRDNEKCYENFDGTIMTFDRWNVIYSEQLIDNEHFLYYKYNGTEFVLLPQSEQDEIQQKMLAYEQLQLQRKMIYNQTKQDAIVKNPADLLVIERKIVYLNIQIELITEEEWTELGIPCDGLCGFNFSV